MSHCYFKVIISVFLLHFAWTASAQTKLESEDLQLAINKKGYLTAIVNKQTKVNYLSNDTFAPILTLVANNQRWLPSKFEYSGKSAVAQVSFKGSKVVLTLKVLQKKTHLTFEIIGATNAELIEGIVWGPIPLTISGKVGEIIGVVRDSAVAVGLQVLNVKTDGGDYSAEGATFSRGQAALKQKYGSSIQAFSINRDRLRYADTWCGQLKHTPIQPISGENVVGSKIAIISCAETSTLERIGAIELEEGLPHPMFEGIWAKQKFRRGHSYLISYYDEQSIDTMIDYTKRAGLISLYHAGPFDKWGHFELDTTYFPNGKQSVTRCAQLARDAGLHFGVHTLTNFITTNDAYVTPVPDPRLAETGFGTLTEHVDDVVKNIPVSTSEYFDNKNFNFLRTVRIDSELIQYEKVSEKPPYFLLNCKRGAFNTRASAHTKGGHVGKLYDHDYKVFFPNIDLQREISNNIADFFNETKVDHLDFDGFEGCLASGQGDYAVNLFADDFYKRVKHTVLNGPSISKSFYWHMNTYCNWGEPWNGGFREAMQEYRINNQTLFDNNLMPHMLGWYKLTKNTTLSEMEWMLARASAYDAGFALFTSKKDIKENTMGLELLAAIKRWEAARLSNAFLDKHVALMKDTKNEFHLEQLSENKWHLYQFKTCAAASESLKRKQPGEPNLLNVDFVTIRETTIRAICIDK